MFSHALTYLHSSLLFIQHATSIIGIFIILTGVLIAFTQYMSYVLTGDVVTHGAKINSIRLNLGRILILGLEFIVASDLIGTTTTPDFYTLGLAAIIVAIRTLLSFSINRELMSISKEK